jgi:ribosomal-protein-alanine N-acetyltransferase
LKFLETPRLFVRHFLLEDSAELFRLHSNPKVAQWMGDGQPLTYEQCVKWIEVSLCNYQTKGFGASAVVEKSTNEFVGCCGIVYDPERTNPAIPEIIYSFEPHWWGQGLASELVPALLDYGLTQCGLAQIFATIYPENLASQRVLEKAGMIFERKETDPNGVFSLVYSTK